MLLKCPECELQVSDKATTCPHCGYPMKTESKPIERKRKSTKHVRLPNGFGQISEIKNANLSKPFRVMITVGKKENGRPICALLKPQAYFKTYNEAYAALVKYNANPYDLEASTMTMKELYEEWSTKHFPTYKNVSGITTIKCAWSYCQSIHDVPVRDIRTRQIADLLDNPLNKDGKEASASIKIRIKSLLNMLFDYAVQYELTDRNFSKLFKMPGNIRKEISEQYQGHMAYTDEEMKLLWDNVDKAPYVELVLIQCYTGLRPQELCSIKRANVDLEKGFIVAGMKTEAGYNRPIPIHSRIYPYIERYFALSEAQGLENLIICQNPNRKRELRYVNMEYDHYYERFKQAVIPLGLNPNHKPHDARKHFITMAKNAGMNEYAIKLIVGHSIRDLTESVYTERNPDWLKTEIEKIK